MKRLLSFLALFLLIFSPAWASVSPSLSASAVTAHTDISMSYLGMLFGTVGHTINGVSGQMLGKLFYKFNEGLFCAIGVIIAYSSFLTVFRGAGEGKWDNQKSPAFYVILRIVFGIVLIVPSASTGYNLAQDMMMRVVVSGVKMADMTWSYGLQYLNSGGSLFSDPDNLASNEANDPDFLGKAVYTDGSSSMSSGVISQVFKDEVCMFGQNISQYSLNSKTSNGGQSYDSGYSSGQIKPILTGDNYEFGSSGICGDFNWSQLTASAGGVTAPLTCQIGGTVTDGSSSSSSSSSSSVAPTTICPFNFQAAQTIVSDLLPVARDYACQYNSSAKSPSYCDSVANLNTTDIENRTSQAMFSAMLGYINALQPIQASAQSGAKNGQHNFISGASSDGWASAGMYYWNLEKLANQAASAGKMSSFVKKSSVSPPKQFPANVTPPSSTFLKQVVNSSDDTSVKSLYNTYVNTNMKGGQHSSDLVINGGTLLALLFTFFGPLSPLIASITKLMDVLIGGPSTNDPILFLHLIGNLMIQTAGDVFVGGLMMSMIVGAANMTCLKIMQPIKDAMVGWVRPVLFFVCLSFLGQGFLYCYYVPLYPYFIYSFAVMGWLAIVIEAMAAAPLVALGVTHPEGHDFLGKAEQALMLAVSVFVRPALLVIGYFAAMILSYVCLRYLLYTFSYVAWSSDYFSGLGLAGILMTLLVCIPIYFSLFAFVVYQVVTQSYNLIFSLPDYVMRWVGVSQQTGFFNPEKMSGAVQSSFTQSAQKGSQLGQQAMQYYANKKAGFGMDAFFNDRN